MGQSASLSDRVFQATTITDYQRYRLQRLIGRNIRASIGYQIATTASAGANDPLGAFIGDVEQEGIIAEISASLRSNLTVGLNYSSNTSTSTGTTLEQANTRYGFRFSYQF